MTATERSDTTRDEPSRHVVHVALTFEVDDASRLHAEFAAGHAPTAAPLDTLDLPLVHHLVTSIDADLLELHGIRHVATGLPRSRHERPARRDGATVPRHPLQDTPSSLALELGHPGPSRVRAFLREPDDGGPGFAHRHGSHWRLDADEAERVRRRFDDDPVP
ncbi:hypothetical protein [Agrococcus jejuensis]|uniref:Uncharacterized protein n=1 Tax=Agrococcus jejuensis TaxID=399736 RepID=A0A1G8F0T4_9MICO|nr:hypothetical protein [Agrococcus jejuensis]SDH75619.1 hypothetical protein SAMN04489720_2271 [Agrococcus jejuensis]